MDNHTNELERYKCFVTEYQRALRYALDDFHWQRYLSIFHAVRDLWFTWEELRRKWQIK